MKWILSLLIVVSLYNHTIARDIFVGGAGASDNNPGTAAQPFATIQKAASVAVAGDVVKIRAGVYRETITVANSGVTFQNDQGATAIISGLNVLDNAGWTAHNGNIYKKSVTLPVNGYYTSNTRIESNTVIFANQIFKDGEMMFEARWPNIAVFDDMLDRSKYKNGVEYSNGFNMTNLTDAALPLAAPNLVGATLVSNGWFMNETKTITSHSGNTVHWVGGIWDDTMTGRWSRKRYYLTGKLALLDAAKEWHYENGTLYFYQPGGGVPSGTIEYKARNWGFDIRGKSNITIAGLTFIGCEPAVGNGASSNAVIDNIRATYMNHHVRHDVNEWQGVGMSKMFGMKLIGPNSVIKNSELHHSGSSGVWLGANGRAENNLMHDIGYVGYWANPISLWDRDGGQVITRNTIYRTGRSCFDFGYNWNGQHLNVEVSYNDFSQWGMVSQDVGSTYVWGQCVLTGLQYHHNWIHDTRAPDAQEVGINVGIYFDQSTGPGNIHHNVVWNSGASDMYHETMNETRHTGAQMTIYNNTFANAGGVFPRSYVTYRADPLDVQRNNIYRSQLVFAAGSPGNVGSALMPNVNPNFVGTGQGGLAFRLKAGSPAINAGIIIPGVTDGSVGAPDIGAYEFGGTEWVPGYTPVPTTTPANTPPTGAITAPANNASFAQGAPINITATASDANGSVSRVEFFDGTTKLGEDTSSPYTFAFNNATAGTHTLTVRVTDNQNATATSAPVTVTVTANAAPTVSITAPANNAQVAAATPITISATAASTSGTIAKVEFFDGTTKLGEDLSAPYTFVWNNAATGAHSLTARATDNGNLATTSVAINITVAAAVNAPPVVTLTSPANNSQFTNGATITINATASDPNGTVTKVEFFDGTTKLGEDLTSPYSFTWTNAANGAHVVTARATDNGNLVTTSAAATISVSATTNTLPVVAITAPLNNAQFANGNSITISATASDAGGTVTKVEFFDGTTKIGEDLTSPYSFIWTNVAAGTHLLSARATDNLGGVGSSTSINITVNTPGAPAVEAGEDVSLMLPENSLTMNPTVTSDVPVEYAWKQVEGPTTATLSNPATEQVNISELTEGTYIFELSVTNANGISTTDLITITVMDPATSENPALTQNGIPRFFSPNDDGTGDYWEWENNEAFQNSLLTIFNRSGQKIYEAVSYNDTWDGKLDGQPLQPGDYYYIIKMENLADLRGAVRIIR